MAVVETESTLKCFGDQRNDSLSNSSILVDFLALTVPTSALLSSIAQLPDKHVSITLDLKNAKIAFSKDGRVLHVIGE